MAPERGPDTVDGRIENARTGGDTAGPETVTILQSGDLERIDTGDLDLSAGLETVAAGDAPDVPSLAPGERLGRFTIQRLLGAGGMGQVFAARVDDGHDDSEWVALKYLEGTSASMLYRFKQEFRALAGVTHANLVELGELVVLPDQATFFTMELVDGVAFDDYVRGNLERGALPNIARLERALRQLVEGVGHLHRHDCIHRDLKPSNVLVTPEGRVVILDFGLVQDRSELELEDSETPDDQILGTPAYMSPEQAGLERAGPSADFYAVGVMLFECLTGKRPFEGTLTHLLFAKREFDPPDVSEIVPEAPERLVGLCNRLLARNPDERPSARAILAILEGSEFVEPGSSLSASLVGRTAFVGRRAELAGLLEGWRRHREDESPVTVHVRGRSGYGKSALVREFLGRMRVRTDELVILRGRCLERESVPYKGVDAVVDALSVHLRQLAQPVLAQLRPEHPGALVRLFPVLGDLWPGSAVPGEGGGVGAHELRQWAFAALRELFAGVAQRRPLIVFVDDFQWANLDSVRLLTELLRPPDAPEMLTIVAYRDEVETNEVLGQLTGDEALAGRDVREVFVGPMPEAEARQLAIALMGDAHDEARADVYAAGAEGSPFYVAQMVHGATAEGASPGHLDQLVVRRILGLDADSRRLLEVVAVAGGPVAREVAFRAAELADPGSLIPDLAAAELLRVRGDRLEIEHDRIREVTVGELAPERLRETHLHLARALEGAATDPETLAAHFERGGDRARAAEHYERAAEQACNSLAFRRAVTLYRRTLALLAALEVPGTDPRVLDLRAALAEQLINIGHGHEASQLLLQVADDGAADPARARECRRQAADQLIKTGHVDAGLQVLDGLLRSVGFKLPAGKAASLSALVWEQTRVSVRGFEFSKRGADEAPPELLDQIDTCFAVVNGLSTQEVLLSAMFHLRQLRLALTAGEPGRVARALAYQCVIEVAGRDWKRVDEHLRIARSLAAEVDDPALSAFIDVCEASVHWFERRYPTSTRLHSGVLESTVGIPGAAWIRRTAQIHHMFTLVMRGQYGEFRARAGEAIEIARERGDMQQMVEVSSFEATVRVLTGDPEGAQRLLAEALADWKPGRYLFGDVWCYYASVRALMWLGEPEQAVALSKETLAQMRRTFLDQNALCRHNVEELTCRTYLVGALVRDDPGYARRARRMAGKLRAQGNPVLTAHVAVIEAGLASREGQRDAALAGWAEAEGSFAEYAMAGHVAACRARRASVLGDEGEGPQLAAQARAYFESEGIVDEAAIDGYLRVVAPASPDRLR